MNSRHTRESFDFFPPLAIRPKGWRTDLESRCKDDPTKHRHGTLWRPDNRCHGEGSRESQIQSRQEISYGGFRIISFLIISCKFAAYNLWWPHKREKFKNILYWKFLVSSVWALNNDSSKERFHLTRDKNLCLENIQQILRNVVLH